MVGIVQGDPDTGERSRADGEALPEIFRTRAFQRYRQGTGIDVSRPLIGTQLLNVMWLTTIALTLAFVAVTHLNAKHYTASGAIVIRSVERIDQRTILLDAAVMPSGATQSQLRIGDHLLLSIEGRTLNARVISEIAARPTNDPQTGPTESFSVVRIQSSYHAGELPPTGTPFLTRRHDGSVQILDLFPIP